MNCPFGVAEHNAGDHIGSPLRYSIEDLSVSDNIEEGDYGFKG